jgi:WD40 repeat protein
VGHETARSQPPPARERPNGRLLASGEGGTVRIWDVAGRQSRGVPIRVGSTITALAFSHDGQTLGVGAADEISLWDVPTGTRLGEPLHVDGQVQTVAFSSNARTLTSDGGRLYVWNPLLWSRRFGDFADRLCQVADRNLTPSEWRQFLPGQPYRETCG